YGTSAAPLSQRHPHDVVHLVLPPWPTAVVGLLLLRRPVLAGLVAAVMTARVNRQVEDLPTSGRLVLGATLGTASGVGRGMALAGPLAWCLARDRRAAALLLLPVVREWWARRPQEHLAAYVPRALLD